MHAQNEENVRRNSHENRPISSLDNVMTRTHVLTRVDTRPIDIASDEIVVVTTVRNEYARLPHFLDYYRRQGVGRFLVIDNDSSDGTADLLRSQTDCHVFHTRNSYRDSRFGIAWQNTLLDTYGVGRWCLTVDADELLVYPHCEHVDMRDLCHFLDNAGDEALYTFLLDMYPEGRLADAVCEPGTPYLEVCPYFDREYAFVERLKVPGMPPLFPPLEVIGGPRLRLFYPEQRGTRLWPRVWPRVLAYVGRVLAFSGLVDLRRIPQPAPLLYKVPLVKWRSGCEYRASTHKLAHVKLSEVTGVLLHFKFFADFDEKAHMEATRGEHYASGSEYARYLRCPEALHGLRYEGSVAYRGSDVLLTQGLLKTTRAFDQLRMVHSDAAVPSLSRPMISKGTS